MDNRELLTRIVGRRYARDGWFHSDHTWAMYRNGFEYLFRVTLSIEDKHKVSIWTERFGQKFVDIRDPASIANIRGYVHNFRVTHERVIRGTMPTIYWTPRDEETN